MTSTLYGTGTSLITWTGTSLTTSTGTSLTTTFEPHAAAAAAKATAIDMATAARARLDVCKTAQVSRGDDDLEKLPRSVPYTYNTSYGHYTAHRFGCPRDVLGGPTTGRQPGSLRTRCTCARLWFHPLVRFHSLWARERHEGTGVRDRTEPDRKKTDKSAYAEG